MPSALIAFSSWVVRLLLLGAGLLNPVHAATGATGAGVYRLDVTFDLARSRLMGTADIQPARPGRLTVDLGEIKILFVTADGRPVALPADADAPLVVKVRKQLYIRYEAEYPADAKEQISPAGIALAGERYPVAHGSYRYRLRAVLPEGWQGVSEADAVSRVAVADGVRHEFLLPHALPHQDGISLLAGDRFVVTQRKYRDVELAAFFLPEDAHHAQRFLAMLSIPTFGFGDRGK